MPTLQRKPLPANWARLREAKKRKPLKRRKKLRKKSPLTALKRKAWAVFSKWIRERDNYTCITCGKVDRSPTMHAGHFRHGDNMDFVEKNINAQCAGCNTYRHGSLDIYAVRLDEKWGPGTAKEMVELSKQYRGYRRQDYEEVIRKYLTAGKT